MSKLVAVLILVFHLHGGFIETQAIQAPTLKQCEDSKQKVIDLYMKDKFKIAASAIVRIDAKCVEI